MQYDLFDIGFQQIHSNLCIAQIGIQPGWPGIPLIDCPRHSDDNLVVLDM